ncbi:hypothetical protein PGT21_000044 [Puccinia graminis f. sp. tritici]|uniref:Uncharacterized protein n=1 Tax=Puccinia graminis f. sp. tritici TaxID=56615 RepID=A0A5B0LPH7_PUCGR|nr:hypothetical protein PGT21_000044 [Puccinia graminis f. sp. tritici]
MLSRQPPSIGLFLKTRRQKLRLQHPISAISILGTLTRPDLQLTITIIANKLTDRDNNDGLQRYTTAPPPVFEPEEKATRVQPQWLPVMVYIEGEGRGEKREKYR